MQKQAACAAADRRMDVTVCQLEFRVFYLFPISLDNCFKRVCISPELLVLLLGDITFFDQFSIAVGILFRVFVLRPVSCKSGLRLS